MTRSDAHQDLPSISVVIPTKNRALELERTIDSLCRQTIAPAQLVIVDQSPTDDEHKIVADKLSASPIGGSTRLDFVHDTTLNSAGAARNRGMELAEGDIWVFLDDDVGLERDFLEELLSAYRAYPRVDGVSGIVTNYGLPEIGFRIWNRIFMRGHFFDERQPIYWRADRLRNSLPIRVYKFTGALMSFRAAVVRDLRFDERLLGASWGEDTDLTIRLGADARLYIAPRARLSHNQSPIGRSREHWLQRFVECNHFLYRKNWDYGVKNRLCFAWLNVGCAFAALAASLRVLSPNPWHSLAKGAAQAGARLALKPASERMLTTYATGGMACQKGR